MKIIDRNGRLFGKISVIDVLVIAAVAVIAVALYVKMNHREITSTAGDVPITYQITASGVRNYVADAVQTGDKLYEDDRDTGGSLGEIIDVRTEPGTSLAQFNDGTIVPDTPTEDSVNLILTVRGTGIVSQGSYMLNRIYYLGVNSSRTFCTRYAQFTGVVTEIEPVA